MIIQNEKDIREIGINWNKTVSIIEQAVHCLGDTDFAQPIKPYLKYRNPENRIIAMPAFIGGEINMAGIKWISSFPGNIAKGMARAHSVVILNDSETGQPVGIINTPLLSIIRTASVSGLIVKYFLRSRSRNQLRIGMTGFGPIGQYHVRMLENILPNRIESISIFDINEIDSSLTNDFSKINFVNRWEEAYSDADIFITCTVAKEPYIDRKPKPGSLHLNVSLRDYKIDVFQWFKNSIIVDDWEEVCREKTDVEMMHFEKGLEQENAKSIVDVVKKDCMKSYDDHTPIMFNPMGMAVFDVALGSYYHKSQASINV